MEFGSEDTLSIINRYLETGDSAAYDALYTIIRRDTRLLLRRWQIQPHDIEDIIQDIEISVFQHLVPFFLIALQNSVSQRNAWLKTIVNNRVFDFFRSERTRKAIAYPNALEETFELIDKAAGPETEFEVKVTLYSALKNLFTIKTTPEKVMCFLMAKLNSTRVNGSIQDVCNIVNGKTLRDIYDLTKKAFTQTMGYAIPNDILSLLWDRVEPKQNNEIYVSARRITDTSSWIVTKMKDCKDE